jgi:hypothetical protein
VCVKFCKRELGLWTTVRWVIPPGAARRRIVSHNGAEGARAGPFLAWRSEPLRPSTVMASTSVDGRSGGMTLPSCLVSSELV